MSERAESEISGQIRIIAISEEEALEIAGYLNRISGGYIHFHRPQQGRYEWLVYGEVEVPDHEDTRNRKKRNEP